MYLILNQIKPISIKIILKIYVIVKGYYINTFYFEIKEISKKEWGGLNYKSNDEHIWKVMLWHDW